MKRLLALVLSLVMLLCIGACAEAAVADSSEMAAVESVVEDGMTPIDGSMLVDGTYAIEVNSSSSMFNIVACELVVEDGQMTATMTMGGTGYLYVYMGTGEEAVAADESAYIAFVENEAGEHTFTVPVEALDASVDCTAFSKKKEKWYDRQLCFKSSALPLEAFKDGGVTTVEALGLADGTYTAELTFEGGSGRTTVESPATIRVEDGIAYATLVWSSPNYDYVIIGGEKYTQINTEGNSVFEVPIAGFDHRLAIIGDTLAMSEPHEIEYTICFDSTTIVPAE